MQVLFLLFKSSVLQVMLQGGCVGGAILVCWTFKVYLYVLVIL